MGNEQELRGLHVAIINPSDGKVEYIAVFDTYKSPDSLDSFINCDASFYTERIIAVACKDECSKHLSYKAKEWF